MGDLVTAAVLAVVIVPGYLLGRFTTLPTWAALPLSMCAALGVVTVHEAILDAVRARRKERR